MNGSGTLLVKIKSSPYYDVMIDNDTYRQTNQYNDNPAKGGAYWNTFVKDTSMLGMVTDVPSADDEDKEALFKLVRFKLGHLASISLRKDLKIQDLDVTVNTGCVVHLNYHTLRVLSSAHKNARGWAGASVERSTRDRGEIIWGAGFAVTVR